jgi:alkylated DNA repair dioxygenase AlkB
MSEFIDLNLKDGDVLYYPNFFSSEESLNFFERLLNDTKWQQDKIKIFGKEYLQPRLTALYANNSKTYSYSNITMSPHMFTSEMLQIKQKVENIIGEDFTSCLLNLYRNGNDSNGWHADDEKELGSHPVIASISLGAHRMFHLKHKKKPNLRHKIILENGSLLLMRGETQHYWLHQIPKTRKDIDKRINLTFRIIK